MGDYSEGKALGVKLVVRVPPPNQALHLTGAALLVSRGIKVLQAAPAGELGRSAAVGSASGRAMNEAMWLACLDPTPMLNFLRDSGSDRKFRLFGLSCCQDIAPLLDPRSRSSLVTVERYADGLRSRSTLARARFTATQVLEEASQADRGGALVVKWLCHDDVWLQCGGIARESAAFLASRQPRHLMKAVRRLALLNRARLLLDIFTPFRPVVFAPQWRTSTVAAIAAGAYESQDFSALPILADALEEAGCGESLVLNHCRSGGPHVRGCWVVDGLLGRAEPGAAPDPARM